MNGFHNTHLNLYDQGAIILENPQENHFKLLETYDYVSDSNLDKICFPTSGINNTQRECVWIKHGNFFGKKFIKI